MIGEFTPVPLSRRNVRLFHQKGPRHAQLLPGSVVEETAWAFKKLHKRGAPKLGEPNGGSDHLLPPLHLSSRFASRLPPLSPFSSAYTHTFFSQPDFISSSGERGKWRKSLPGRRNRWVRSGVQPGQVKSNNHLQRSNITGVCVSRLAKGGGETHDCISITHTQSTEVGQKAAQVLIWKQETGASAHAPQK